MDGFDGATLSKKMSTQRQGRMRPEYLQLPALLLMMAATILLLIQFVQETQRRPLWLSTTA